MASSPFTACERCGTPVVDLHQHLRRQHGIDDLRRIDTCEYCGTAFERDSRDQQYCSPSCATSARQTGGAYDD
jgi:endogenous inhibitor of DNA gyrase (YacG/DUF329 family)